SRAPPSPPASTGSSPRSTRIPVHRPPMPRTCSTWMSSSPCCGTSSRSRRSCRRAAVSEPRERGKGEAYALALLLAVVVAALWAPRLGRSFWLDETETFWFAKDGPAAAVERYASIRLPTPVAYILLESLLGGAGGREVALRMPSFVAALA